MANFPIPPSAGGTPYQTLGNVVNDLEKLPDSRRLALTAFVQSAKPYKDDPLKIPAVKFKFSGTGGDAGIAPWSALDAQINLADRNSAVAAQIDSLNRAAEDHASRFFGPAGLSKSERDALLRQLIDIFTDPRKTLKSIGDRNASRAAVRGLLDAEVQRARSFAPTTEYALPPQAIVTAVDRAYNRIDVLDSVALTALERRFLEFDRGLQGELVQARLQAMRALYGEIGASYTTSLMFASQVAVPAFSRPKDLRRLTEELSGRYARIYADGVGLAGSKQLTADEATSANIRETYASWRARHDIRNQAFSEATRAVAASAAEVSRQLSAALNAVSGSGDLSGAVRVSESYPTITVSP